MTQPDIEQRTQAYSKTIAMARPLFEERRQMPQDDLLSHLLDETIDGRPLTQRELEGICTLLFGAGLDTVVNSIAFSMEHLASDPALQDRLRRQPELIPDAVEELLRCYGVATASRSVAKDGTFHGATLKAGERVSLFLQAGNLDPAVFPAAEKFDLDRENKAHITFNSGPHRCVGSHLVRIEMAVLFEEWLKRMPNVRLNPASPPGYRTGVIFAVTSLPLLWDIPS
jgi:cytochrome P450